MKVKIAFIIPTLSLGGAEKQQVNILNGIDTSQYQIKVFVLKDKVQLIDQIKNKEIEIEVIHMNRAFDFIKLIFLIKRIKQFSPHIIHSQMYNANLLSRFIKIFFPHVKLINHYHGLSIWLKGIRLFIDNITKCLVDKFIVVSKPSYELRLQREQYKEEDIIFLSNSVAFTNLLEKPDIKTIKTIGVASRLIPLKNIKGAIHLFAELFANDSCYRLLIAGEGPERNNLEQQVKNLNIENYVTFLGFVENMESFYKEIDIFCISSFTEDLPLSVLEALTSGKPVIASKVGGIPDVLDPLTSKLVIEDFFDEKEVNKVIYFLSNIDFNYCFKETQSYALANFSNEMYCDKLNNIYKRLINN